MEMDRSENIGSLNAFIAVVFAVIAAFGLGVFLGGTGTIGSGASGNTEFSSSYLSEVARQVERKYLGDLPSQRRIDQELARGLVAALDDEFSYYLSPDEAQIYADSAESTYEGIGVYLGFDGQYTVIQTPIDGLPGEKSGLLAGDIVLEVDGQDVAGQNPQFTSSLIVGEAGTVVNLTIYRESEARTIDFSISREKIDLDNISYEELDNGLFFIDIIRFTEGDEGGVVGAEKFNDNWDRIVEEIANKNPRGLIIDLRNNPGGFVSSVEHVMDEFFSSGTVLFIEEEKDLAKRTIYATRNGRFEDIPIVVLVNGGSASAAEIFAAAVQDHDRGPVIGTETYGKGVEQILVDLEDGGLILITYRRWLTPNERQLTQEKPIFPDEVIEYESPISVEERDSQFKRALDILK